MGTWLKRQPRSLSVALAARVALRVLPVYTGATDVSVRDLVLPVFRAAAVSWAAAKYPAHKKESPPALLPLISAVSRLRLASGLDAPYRHYAPAPSCPFLGHRRLYRCRRGHLHPRSIRRPRRLGR